MKSTRVSISCPSDGSDFKTRSHWLAEALGAKWTRRRGYTVASANRAEQFRRLDAAGVDASRRYFASGRQPYTFEVPGVGNGLTLKQALAACPSEPSQPAAQSPAAGLSTVSLPAPFLPCS